MSRVKVNPAYVASCITAVENSNLSDMKKDTVVKILREYLESKVSK